MRYQVTQRWWQALIVAFFLALVGITTLLPLEDSAAMMTLIILGGIGIFGLSLVRDPRERTILLWLFCLAFGLRVSFTFLAYSLDLISKLGGADDTGWVNSWDLSRYWRGWLGYIPTMKGIPGQGTLPETFLDVYDRSRQTNLGYAYFLAVFFYYLDVRSQIALAFINCFMNSMTVVVIYRFARDFFSERASLLAAGSAAILPGYLAWSALTIKETWLILFEITSLFLLWRGISRRSLLYFLGAFALIVLVQGIRFYVGWIMIAASMLSIFCLRSPRPRVTAGKILGGLFVGYVMASALGIIRIDIGEIVMKQMAEFTTFRTNISSSGPGAARFGTNSGVELPYDPTTPFGLFMLILVGSLYLLLSPFPWQLGGRQIFALPDVIVWWFLVFGYIVPGFRYMWRRNENLFIALFSYLTPLILLYSMVFGNVGLAYRQRAQLMPFLLIFAAAGYDARQRRKVASKNEPDREELLKQLRQQLRSLPSPSPANVTAANVVQSSK
jgi:hypothetical protein